VTNITSDRRAQRNNNHQQTLVCAADNGIMASSTGPGSTQHGKAQGKDCADSAMRTSGSNAFGDENVPLHARSDWNPEDLEKYYDDCADSGTEDDIELSEGQAGSSTAPRVNVPESKPRLKQNFMSYLDWFNYDLTPLFAFGNTGRPGKYKIKLVRHTVSVVMQIFALFTAGTGMPWESFLLLLGYQFRIQAIGEKEMFKNFLRNDAGKHC
jgi:hypothetical protein